MHRVVTRSALVAPLLMLNSMIQKSWGLQPGTSRGSNLFGLDGLSRSATLQDGAGFGLEGTFGPPSSAGSEAYYKDLDLSSSQGYVPWGSHMLTQQCELTKKF